MLAVAIVGLAPRRSSPEQPELPSHRRGAAAFAEFARIAGRSQPGCYHLTSGNSFIERLQAARHSALLMCVAASQKPMQSASALPPPPGLLGADSLGLPPGDRARLGEEPPPVANWLGKGSDMGDTGGTVDPGCAVVGAVGVAAAGAPAGGVSPAEGVGDNDVDGAADVGAPEGTLGVVVRVVVGAESLGAGAGADAPPADERACANAASGKSSKRPMAARTGGLDVSIAITSALPAVPLPCNDRPALLRRSQLGERGWRARLMCSAAAAREHW
jgi:hypothetical protein